jgi:hypothetical protein
MNGGENFAAFPGVGDRPRFFHRGLRQHFPCPFFDCFSTTGFSKSIVPQELSPAGGGRRDKSAWRDTR